MPALVSGAAASDRIIVPDSASIRNWTAFGWWGWFYPTTLTANRRLISKVASGSSFKGPDLKLDGTNPNFLLFSISGPTNTSTYTTSSLGLVVNVWHFIGVSFDVAATPRGHIYIGTVTTPMAEPTYSTQTNGTDVTNPDSGADLTFGQASGATTVAFQGSIGPYGILPFAPSRADFERLRNNSRANMSRAMGRYWEPGVDAAGFVRDQSIQGGDGAVTGMTISRAGGPALPMLPFHRLGRQPVRRLG